MAHTTVPTYLKGGAYAHSAKTDATKRVAHAMSDVVLTMQNDQQAAPSRQDSPPATTTDTPKEGKVGRALPPAALPRRSYIWPLARSHPLVVRSNQEEDARTVASVGDSMSHEPSSLVAEPR